MRMNMRQSSPSERERDAYGTGMHVCITVKVFPVCTRSCAQRNIRSTHTHMHTRTFFTC
jgi:hypothetical protein